MSRKSTLTKPKGWRNIVVDGVAYWWIITNTSPVIKRVSDKKTVNTWNYFVERGCCQAMNDHEMSFKPSLIAEAIRDLYI